MHRMYDELKEFNRLVELTGVIPEHKDGDEGDSGIPTRRYILRGISELRQLINTVHDTKCEGVHPVVDLPEPVIQEEEQNDKPRCNLCSHYWNDCCLDVVPSVICHYYPITWDEKSLSEYAQSLSDQQNVPTG